MSDRWLTPTDAADYIGVPAGTLKAWRTHPDRGPDLPYVKHGTANNAPVRYRRSDLDAYLDAHTRVGAS